MRLFSSDEMRAVDLHAINEVGIPGPVLMENAGVRVLFTLEKALGGLHGKRFTIVCGKGNNGGDGLVVARHLLNNNVPVNVFLVYDSESLSDDASLNLNILIKSGLNPVVLRKLEDINRLRIAMEFSDCVVDAVFGTGISGNVTGFPSDVIRAMNDSRAKKVAIDLPSGLCGTTGKVSDPTFNANLTVTLGGPKTGLFVFPGKRFAGEIWTADIGIPNISFDSVAPSAFLLTSELASTCFEERDAESHKGKSGHFLSLSGSNEYAGAAVLTSYGALRSGVGLVTLGLPEEARNNMCQQVLPEVIINEFSSNNGAFDLKEEEVDSFVGKFKAIAAGSGWGRGESQKHSLELLLKKWPGMLLLDADALNNSSLNELEKNSNNNLVLTPHIGEMARLVEKSVGEVQDNPIAEAIMVARKLSAIVVLKSAITIIAEPGGKYFICSRPNSGLARAGSGDLLTGLIGGLMAVTGDRLKACLGGVYLHAEAAELARAELGADSMTISEVASFVPKAFQKLRG